MNELAVTLTVEQLRALMREAASEAVARMSLAPVREVMSLAECAEFLGRHPKVITQYVKEKALPAHYISEREPRFIRAEVLAWLHGLPKKSESEAA